MIESLYSPHVARVKALLGSRGTKERREQKLFVSEGIQGLREGVKARGADEVFPKMLHLYLTASGRDRIESEGISLDRIDVHEISEAVANEMTDTITPQGIIAICSIPSPDLTSLAIGKSSRILYLQEVQDPGNAGTMLRTADAMGFDAVITSAGSVDFYSPKVVRATAGSLWHIPVFQNKSVSDVREALPDLAAIALSADGEVSISDYQSSGPVMAIFGNESRGIDVDNLDGHVTRVSIPMNGRAESLNLSAAASIVAFLLASKG